ncbi:DEAD/DEAH box helicase [Nocardia sp. NPDC004085]
MTWLPFEEALVEEIQARMDLRKPNARGLAEVAKAIQAGDGREVVCDLATGVGKTYLAAALVDYLAAQGVRNILIVTPGSTIQSKTIDNFTPGHPKFVAGAEYEPTLITADNFSRGQVGDALHDDAVVKVFIFNVQQLTKPTIKTSRKTRETDEFIGQGLYDHLQSVGDLVVIADEHHVYREKAKAFGAAVRELNPRAIVGLTATPDESDLDKVVFQYSLADAIADGLVKTPVIVYREDGQKDIETQLSDACHLRARKEEVWHVWADQKGKPQISPVLFVVCQDIKDAEHVANILARDGYLPGEGQVLLITSQSSDKALAELAAVESPDSPVRAVVSVNMLKEGWDVKNIGVIVGYRALASSTLTEQVLGRGLRLPFGSRVGVAAIDHVDLVAHDSYRKLLANKNALLQQLVPSAPELPPAPPSPDGQPMPLPFGESQPGHSEIAENGELHLVGPARIQDGDLVDGTEFLILSSFEAAKEQLGKDQAAASQVLYKVKDAPSIVFPRREREYAPVTFSLSYIENSAAQAIGAAFKHEFPVHLKRQALVAERDMHGQATVRTQQLEDEDATQRYVPVADVRQELEDGVWKLGLVPAEMQELNAAARVAKQFLLGAGVTDDNDEALWSTRRTQQAVKEIAQLIRDAYSNRRLQPKWNYKRVEVPIRRPMPSETASRWEDKFNKNKWYGDWSRSIQPFANFDAKSTEFTLAQMFDSSPHVKWWLRIYEPGEVWIERDNTKKYYPDFIVLDQEDVYWVIEGKSDISARDIEVLDKKKAAEEWARQVRDDGRFGIWRYVFATESIIKQAKTWEELVAKAKPEM